MKIITDNRCTEYSARGHPERPQRISRTVEALRSQTELPISWAEPLAMEDASILRAHLPQHLENLHLGFDFDDDTPAHPNVVAHARRSVGGALHALQCAQQW